MTRKEKPGLQLGRKETIPVRWLPQTLGALLALAAQILIFTELSGFDQGLPVMAAAGSYVCILYGILARYQRESWFFPAALGVLVLAVLLLGGRLTAGYCLFRNQLGQTIVRSTGWMIPELEVPETNGKLDAGVFAALCAAVMALLSCFFAVHAPLVPALTLPVVAMAGMWLLEYTGTVAWFVAVLGISLVILSMGGKMTSSWMGWCVCALAFCVSLAICLPEADGWLKTASVQTRRMLHQWQYETVDTILPEGDLTQTPPQEGESRAGLRVTMEQPQAQYLRGFTGWEFEENTWLPMETERLAEAGTLLSWLNRNAFSLNAQFETAAADLELGVQNVTVENMGACSENLYVPFNLSGGDWLREEDLNPDSVAGFGSRSYSYTVVTSGTEEISQVLEYLQTSDEAGVLTYRRAESAYREFVYRNYLSVSEEVRSVLAEKWDAVAKPYGGVNGLTMQQAQQCTVAFLENCFEDDLELLDAWQGTSYQHATVEVLTLRYFGIPARYAEGYVISSEMAAGAGSGMPIEVDGSCAGAWAEVYQDGIGWIPMALALGLEETAGQSPSRPPETEEPDQEPTREPEQSRDPEEEPGVLLKETIRNAVVLLFLVAMLAFLILMGRRKYRRHLVEKRFAGDDPREAVGWIFADTALLLEAVGISRNGGSMRRLCPEAGQRFGQAYAARLENMIDWNNESLFSSRVMTRQQQADMLAFRQETLALLRKTTKWYRRFHMKWIRCLY